MPFYFSRRRILAAMAIAALSLSRSSKSAVAQPGEGFHLGPSQPFDFETLATRTRELAASPYVPPVIKASDTIERIDFEAQLDIEYRPDRTIMPGTPTPIRLFHPHQFAKEGVHVHLVQSGSAREIEYNPDLFTFGPKAAFARDLPPDVGFAGFRVLNPNLKGDWLAFQGASYFRSSGELDQYGLSARGLAVDCGLSPEEFPLFTHFYLEPANDGVVVYALLDSASIAGAYRFVCRKQKTVTMDAEARLFARKHIKRLGIAPLTSMFWYSELSRADAPDWRPEIHDSDGLAIWTGDGERLWRPLNNPKAVMTNSFVDRTPKGFGLLQRDRNFDNYEDDGVFYDRRPSLWIEPLSDWGEGAVALVEIPTDAEIHDNIVAFWLPKRPVNAGDELAFSYRLHWTSEEPFVPPIARVVSTRRGRGGRPGVVERHAYVKYVIDFAGGEIGRYQTGDPVEPVITTSRGKVVEPYAIRVNTTDRWRIVFDLDPQGTLPVDMRAFLRRTSGEALTETWLYQHLPGVR
jgi:periplasmic glucans biosynthesis protein